VRGLRRLAPIPLLVDGKVSSRPPPAQEAAEIKSKAPHDSASTKKSHDGRCGPLVTLCRRYARKVVDSPPSVVNTFIRSRGSFCPSATRTATITPKGESELHFSFVVVNGGKELLAIEMDDHTVVNGTLQP